jgi:predicted aldo/keto reductase-like oxidoreductase
MPAGSRAGEIIMGDWLGKDTGKLGFGMMRLPKKAVFTDVEETKRMVDLFLDAGFTYFVRALHISSTKSYIFALVS